MAAITLVDDGAVLLWKRPVALRLAGFLWLVGCVVVAVGLAATSAPSGWWVSVLDVGLGLVGGGSLIRPKVRIDNETLTVVTSYRRARHFKVADVVRAESGYYGLTFELAEGAMVGVSLGATSNITRWLGRVSRGDQKAALVMHRAALARGEAPGPIEMEGSRGPGDLSAAVRMALSMLLRAGR